MLIAETRNESIYLRLTKEEKENIKEKADLSNMTISEFIRQSVLTASVKINIINRKDNKQLQELIYQLSKIGTNINQIAHQMNAGIDNDINIQSELSFSLGNVNSLIEKCYEALEAPDGSSQAYSVM